MAYGIMAYGTMAYCSTPYIGMTPKKKKAARLNVCIRLVEGLHEPYQVLSSVSMSHWTFNSAGEHH